MLDPCSAFNQGQDHFRDPGSNGVPLRASHHTQRPQARKHFGGQGFSHQGTGSPRHVSLLLLCQHSEGSLSLSIPVRLQTLVWPPAKRGASSQRRRPAGRARRKDQWAREEPAPWATWLQSTWTAYIPSLQRNLMFTALRLWFGSF